MQNFKPAIFFYTHLVNIRVEFAKRIQFGFLSLMMMFGLKKTKNRSLEPFLREGKFNTTIQELKFDIWQIASTFNLRKTRQVKKTLNVFIWLCKYSLLVCKDVNKTMASFCQLARESKTVNQPALNM